MALERVAPQLRLSQLRRRYPDRRPDQPDSRLHRCSSLISAVGLHNRDRVRSDYAASMIVALGVILAAVLLGPIFIEPIGRNIELFFLAVGLLTPILTATFGWPMLHELTSRPIMLTLAVLVFGAAARLARPAFDLGIQRLRATVPARFIYPTLMLTLGLLSCVITAVIAALLLVEAIAILNVDRESEVAAVVLACFAIGLGSGFDGSRRPLAAIAIASLDAKAVCTRFGWNFPEALPIRDRDCSDYIMES